MPSGCSASCKSTGNSQSLLMLCPAWIPSFWLVGPESLQPLSQRYCLIYFYLYRCNPSQLSDFKRAGQEQRWKFEVLGHVHRTQIYKVAESHCSRLAMISLVFRLTGLYAIVIGLHATLLKFFATGVQASTFGRLTNLDRINVAELSSIAAVRVLPKQLVDQLALRQQSPLDQRGGDGMCGARMVRHLVRNNHFVQP